MSQPDVLNQKTSHLDCCFDCAAQMRSLECRQK